MSRIHRKVVRLVPGASQAMVETRTAIELDRRFVLAVKSVYVNHKLHLRPAEQVVDIICVTFRRQQLLLAEWDGTAVTQALYWLAERRAITLRDPELALAG